MKVSSIMMQHQQHRQQQQQEAPNRTVVSATIDLKERNEVGDISHSLSVSPSISTNASPLNNGNYPQNGLAAPPFSFLPASRLYAANRHAAAAFMAAQLPMSTLFSYPSLSLLGSWAAPTTTTKPPSENHQINGTHYHPTNYPQINHLTVIQAAMAATHSPPPSPHSPANGVLATTTATAAGTATAATAAAIKENIISTNKDEQQKIRNGVNAKLNLTIIMNNNDNDNNNKAYDNNYNDDEPIRKSRKLRGKRASKSLPLEISTTLNVNHLYGTNTAPISPPSSGSSPNSSTQDLTSPVGSAGSNGNGNGNGNNNVNGSSTNSVRNKSFTCKICKRSFGYKHVLQNHERTHTGEKPFKCTECHKRFTRDHHLKTHIRLHTGEKPYHCSHCSRRFVQVANLRRHLRVHTGEKPYICDICENKFSDSNQLKAHMLVHNGEKPFDCERCHQKFRRRHHLINHKCGSVSPTTRSVSPTSQLSSSLLSPMQYESHFHSRSYNQSQTPSPSLTTTTTPVSTPTTLSPVNNGGGDRKGEERIGEKGAGAGAGVVTVTDHHHINLNDICGGGVIHDSINGSTANGRNISSSLSPTSPLSANLFQSISIACDKKLCTNSDESLLVKYKNNSNNNGNSTTTVNDNGMKNGNNDGNIINSRYMLNNFKYKLYSTIMPSSYVDDIDENKEDDDDHSQDGPLDLSEEGCNSKLSNKYHQLYSAKQFDMPEQTEPEDLSVRSDDKRKMKLKQQQQQQQKAEQINFSSYHHHHHSHHQYQHGILHNSYTELHEYNNEYNGSNSSGSSSGRSSGRSSCSSSGRSSRCSFTSN